MGVTLAERIEKPLALSMAGRVNGDAVTLVDDGPFGRVYQIPYESATCYRLMTSEHTGQEHLSEMLSKLPDRLCYSHCVPLKRPFDEQATRCVVHYIWSFSGRVPLARRPTNPKIVLSTEILCLV